MDITYVSLEPSFIQPFGNLPTTIGEGVSLYQVVSFLWTAGLVACVGAVIYVVVKGSIFRLNASEAGIRKSKEEWSRGLFGFVGVFSLFLLIYTVNRGLLLGDVGLQALRVERERAGTVVTTPTRNPSSGSSASSGGAMCGSQASVVQDIQSGDVCRNARCTVLAGCNYSQYLPTIRAEAERVGVDPNILIVLMCKESGARPEVNNRNENGTYDCGLMQVNKTTPCDAADLDPATNIRRGADQIRQKISAASSRTYPGVPQEANAFAAYNCCANGDRPYDASADCTTGNGFPNSIPKWACPINPGTGSFNMCTVNNYACGAVACLRQLRGS